MDKPEFDAVEQTDAEGGGGINQKLDYPFLLLYQMQKISQKFSEGNITGGIYIIKLMEASCSFKDNDGWKAKITALNTEFEPRFKAINAQKTSMYESIKSRGVSMEFDTMTEYWLRRYDILMSLNKMKNMLYKETEVGEIR
jgi:hypothetical protein